MDFLSLVALLLIVMNPIGLAPAISGILSGFDEKRRTKILIRELLFTLLILLVLMFFGTPLMKLLGMNQAALSISGGVLLLLVALGMVFPALNVTNSRENQGEKEEPFIVPIAIPLLAGPSCIAIILLHSAKAEGTFDMFMLFLAIFITWVVAFIGLLLSQYIIKYLGNKGASALERLMGMLLVLISVKMFLDGLSSYNC